MMYFENSTPFWARTLAHNIDLTLILIPGFLMQFISDNPPWLKYLWLLIYGLYHLFWEMKRKPSPGKYLLGLHVISVFGHSPSSKDIIIRNLSRYLSILTLGIGYLLAALPPKNMALHDRLSNTRIIRLRNNEKK